MKRTLENSVAEGVLRDIGPNTPRAQILPYLYFKIDCRTCYIKYLMTPYNLGF